jgi:hypothetical protein
VLRVGMSMKWITGVDALTVGFKMKGAFDEGAWNIAQHRAIKAKQREAGEFDFCGRKVNVKAHGSGNYAWVFSSPDLRGALSPYWQEGKHYPELMLTANSVMLWREGFCGAFNQLHDVASELGEVVGDVVSRVDLCGDYNFELPDVGKERIGGRVQARSEFSVVEHMRGKSTQGYSFGRGDLTARLYTWRASGRGYLRKQSR